MIQGGHHNDRGRKLVGAGSEGGRMSGWTTIESDPGIFTELMSGIGARDIEVTEVYDLDQLDLLKPVYGLIFLFKWRPEPPSTASQDCEGVFFAKQVITNACATQAILSVLMNREEIDIGDELTQFKEFTKDLPPDMRGLSIGNSDTIRRVHNSFARPEPFLLEKRAATDKDDAYHFISYVPVRGQLYELDGLQAGPIAHGAVTDEDWLARAKQVVRARMERYSQQEVHFSLMAVVSDQRRPLQRQLAALYLKRCAMAGADAPALPSTLEDQAAVAISLFPEAAAEGGADDAAAAAAGSLERLDAQLASVARSLSAEEERHEKWRLENVRRRHNYIPFVVEVLRVLASKGALMPLVEQSRGR